LSRHTPSNDTKTQKTSMRFSKSYGSPSNKLKMEFAATTEKYKAPKTHSRHFCSHCLLQWKLWNKYRERWKWWIDSTILSFWAVNWKYLSTDWWHYINHIWESRLV
jgi:hypothetical protein